ncbi:MAG: DUF1501 domain-containing protein, partial [Planctomycetaceae bacterium]
MTTHSRSFLTANRSRQHEAKHPLNSLPLAIRFHQTLCHRPGRLQDLRIIQQLQCLLARRMVERGVRFVQLYHRGWDQHYNLPSDL